MPKTPPREFCPSNFQNCDQGVENVQQVFDVQDENILNIVDQIITTGNSRFFWFSLLSDVSVYVNSNYRLDLISTPVTRSQTKQDRGQNIDASPRTSNDKIVKTTVSPRKLKMVPRVQKKRTVRPKSPSKKRKRETSADSEHHETNLNENAGTDLCSSDNIIDTEGFSENDKDDDGLTNNEDSCLQFQLYSITDDAPEASQARYMASEYETRQIDRQAACPVHRTYKFQVLC